MAKSDFLKSIQANSKKILQQVNDEIFRRARELFTEVVDRTPSPVNPGYWAKGQLANQWYTAVNGFSDAFSSATSSYGADSLSRIDALQGASFLGRDGQVSLTNNTPWAYQAEALGWARTGGYHMVRLSMQWIGSKYK